jgi:hypothetical protein
VVAVPESVQSGPPDPFEATAAFPDHRWHQVVDGADTAEVFLCDDCGVVWTI